MFCGCLNRRAEPDIIECDGRLYVPDEECEFVPEEFDTVWDEEDQCLRIAKPSDDCDCFTCSKAAKVCSIGAANTAGRA